MSSNASRRYLFSRFVNWFSSTGQDKPAINRSNRDLLSKLMNRISG